MNDEKDTPDREPPTQPVPAPDTTPEPATEPVVVPPSLGPEPATEPVAAPEPQGEIASQPAVNPPVAPAPETDEPPTAPLDGEGPAQPSEEEPVSADKVFLFEEQQFEIAEVQEGADESDDGFATIPPGPTEEVDYDEDRARHPRRMGRERGRGRGRGRERMPAAETPGGAAPVAQPQGRLETAWRRALARLFSARAEARAHTPVARRYRTAIIIIIAIILLALLIIAFAIWYNWTGRRAGHPGQAAGVQTAVPFVKEMCHV